MSASRVRIALCSCAITRTPQNSTADHAYAQGSIFRERQPNNVSRRAKGAALFVGGEGGGHGSIRTWIAQYNVMPIDRKYTAVAMTRPFSIIFLMCVHGPERNIVLRSKQCDNI